MNPEARKRRCEHITLTVRQLRHRLNTSVFACGGTSVCKQPILAEFISAQPEYLYKKKRINLQKHINGKNCHVRAHKPRHKRKIAVAGTHITQKGDPPFGESPIIRLIHQLHLTTTLRMLPSDILTIFIPLSGLLRRRPSMP